MILHSASLRQAVIAPARLLVDVTTLVAPPADPQPGIADLVGTIAQELLRQASHHPIPVIIRHDGAILALGPDQVEGLVARDAARAVARLRQRSTDPPPPPAVVVRPTEQVSGVRARVARTLRRVARLGLARLPPAMRDDARAILAHARQIARGGTRTAEIAAAPARGGVSVPPDDVLQGLRMVAYPRPGDVLWTATLSGRTSPLRHLARLRAEAGVKVCVAALDPGLTLPADTASFVLPADPGLTDALALLDASDLLLVPTGWMRDRLVAFAAAMQRPEPSVTVFRPGWDAGEGGADQDSAALRAIGLGGERRFALAAGAVTPHGNVGFLVDLWTSLCARPDFDLDLVIVGAAAPNAATAAAEVEASPLFGTRIHWVEECRNDTLRALYRASHVVLCPSLRDGIGFGVMQALCHDRPVIAARRGALPEVAMGLARLLDSEDRAAWIAAIAEAAASPRRDAPRHEAALPADRSGDTAAAQIVASLQDLLGSVTRGAA